MLTKFTFVELVDGASETIRFYKADKRQIPSKINPVDTSSLCDCWCGSNPVEACSCCNGCCEGTGCCYDYTNHWYYLCEVSDVVRMATAFMVVPILLIQLVCCALFK